MNKIKLLPIILMMFLAIATVTANETNTTTITFEGVDFTIPDGFNQSKDHEDYNDLGSEGKTCFYVNEANGQIQITVISDWMGISLEELYKDGATKSQINGHEGWNYTEGDLHYFGYVQDDTGILVGVTNETRLFEIII